METTVGAAVERWGRWGKGDGGQVALRVWRVSMQNKTLMFVALLRQQRPFPVAFLGLTAATTTCVVSLDSKLLYGGSVVGSAKWGIREWNERESKGKVRK